MCPNYPTLFILANPGPVQIQPPGKCPIARSGGRGEAGDGRADAAEGLAALLQMSAPDHYEELAESDALPPTHPTPPTPH